MTISVSMYMFAQSYDALWKQYRVFADKDQPKSALVILEKIKTKAEKEAEEGVDTDAGEEADADADADADAAETEGE